MARVNVEQKALTDPRFYRLGIELGAETQYAQAVGLFAMIRIWNECIERGRYTLDGWMLQAVIGKTDGADLVVKSDLAVALAGNRFRVRGTKGRVEYLEEKRKLARINGRKGGRPRKPTSVIEKTNIGSPGETPPAPAPAPAPAPVQEPKTTRATFVPPTADQIQAYFAELGKPPEAERFMNYYTANGWKVGRNPMKDWRAAARNWAAGTYSLNGKPEAPGRKQPTESETKRLLEQYRRESEQAVSDPKADVKLAELLKAPFKPVGPT